MENLHNKLELNDFPDKNLADEILLNYWANKNIFSLIIINSVEKQKKKMTIYRYQNDKMG